MAASGSKIFGKDYLSSTSSKEVWVPLRLLPDGSIATTASMVVDEGVATGGTNITLTDTTKDWEANIHEGGLVEIIHAGKTYQRAIQENTATTLSFATIGVAVVAGDVYRILKAIDPMTPISRGFLHNQAYLTPANFMGAAIYPIISPSLFRCQIACSVAGVFYSTITRAGVTVEPQFNHGVVLPANALFEFDLLVEDGETINYRYSVNCTILTFKVLEIPSAI